MPRTYKVQLKKIAELPNAMNPNRHPVGMERIGLVKEEHFPEEDQTFVLDPLPGATDSFVTSRVTALVGYHKFETMNSRYEYEIIGTLD